jgi:hypothetical protein
MLTTVLVGRYSSLLLLSRHSGVSNNADTASSALAVYRMVGFGITGPSRSALRPVRLSQKAAFRLRQPPTKSGRSQ